MHPILDALIAARVVPVIRTSTRAHAATAVAWLKEAGMRIAEITLTTPGATALIADLARDPELLVGAGTVPDAEAARACIAAGAKFLVTPWVDPAVCAIAREHKVAMLAGAFTPTEIRAALAAGADAVKIFPASTGGTGHLKALVSVFPGVKFCPTGGVDARNIPDWIAAGAAFVGMGGRLVDETAIARGDKASVQAAAWAALGIERA
ncbi:2-dehydro-3-deoxyphosphogluconate aldolase/(4S)-4-hydroxy-2-oxoglutarate aldolase [Humitalea rosea]|uniref:2-dehydro-3-deoxyphosphogluconate aldolase/(4S)-4-hydroxy-2-oxoglutarate aldolase n=1 Tax=Humitalea rosea TaxID=990373 RepID=A0A2W7HYF6_9PROT|nr:bifunctional 4-hydroxy-2-oxoglutarate aldolase/2-dehydro-3-deoxy-phosphogluconate aldolase [Humitalea rosea]PZW38969.1 2-dehydro-3-deoxyphosphogluconate aldolase/(4S)-4-hydroxy-2-oxoglutarate aldolase [Humitalea rosea]